jgi:hypothetical protein
LETHNNRQTAIESNLRPRYYPRRLWRVLTRRQSSIGHLRVLRSLHYNSDDVARTIPACSGILLSPPFGLCVCVCVCVCIKSMRTRKRQQQQQSHIPLRPEVDRDKYVVSPLSFPFFSPGKGSFHLPTKGES